MAGALFEATPPPDVTAADHTISLTALHLVGTHILDYEDEVEAELLGIGHAADLAHELLARGADASARDAHGCTPMECAVT